MNFKNLLRDGKNKLKSTKTILTTPLGEKFEISNGKSTKLEEKTTPFIVDAKPNLDVNLIIPGLFLSSQDPVSHQDILSFHNIKHILSLGVQPVIRLDGIQYYYIEILDIPEFDLTSSLKICSEIIHKNRINNILVHCNAGVSRAPTVVISYLMIIEGLNYDQAFERVKSIRNYINPNNGFINQLKVIDFSHFQKFISNNYLED